MVLGGGHRNGGVIPMGTLKYSPCEPDLSYEALTHAMILSDILMADTVMTTRCNKSEYTSQPELIHMSSWQPHCC